MLKCSKRQYFTHRLSNLAKKKKSKNSDLLHAYNEIIENQLNAKVIEPVLETYSILPGQVHYLPHRPIIKTTKVRMVYDASSNATRPSLNDFLYPALCKSLFGLLLQFRINSIAFISHIEKVFLQILLHPRDKDIVRFIWSKM